MLYNHSQVSGRKWSPFGPIVSLHVEAHVTPKRDRFLRKCDKICQNLYSPTDANLITLEITISET